MKFVGSIFFAVVLSLVIVSSAVAGLTAQVKQTSAGPKLYINGKPTAPAMFYVNYDTSDNLRDLQYSEIESAAKNGVVIVSFPVPRYWIQRDDKIDFSETDKKVEETIKHSPNAYLLLRLGVSRPPQWWCDENPEEAMLYNNGEQNMPSIFSEKWKVDAAKTVKLMVEHLESKYGDHIIGYHPVGMNTGEWFSYGLWTGKLGGFEKPAVAGFRAYLKQKYGTDQALQKAWNNPTVTLGTASVATFDERTHLLSGAFRNPETERCVIDYAAFENDTYADVALYMCQAAKEAAPNKITALFYGYHYELAAVPHGLASSGHLGLDRLLRSPYVDIISSPVSYFDRDAGGGGYFMSAIDSIQLAGKLWLVEDDTRTYLAPEVQDNLPRLKTAQETYGVLTRNFAHVLTHGCALWWMDLYGNGRFQGDEIWQTLGKLSATYQAAIPSFKRYSPEIAIIIDQRSQYYADPVPPVNRTLLAAFRQQFYRIGAPVGLYLLDDLTAGKVPPAKMYIFLDTFRLDDSQLKAIKKYTSTKGCVNLWMYCPGVIDNDKMLPDRVQDVVGIKLKKLQKCSGAISYNSGKFTACDGFISGSYAVIDPSAKTIAKYAESADVAVASKDMGGYTNVYCGVTALPSYLLRQFAVMAGVHVYSDQSDVVMAGNGFVALAASSNGVKKLSMPFECSLQDVLTSEKYGPAKQFSFEMALGDARIWRVTFPESK
ncbi:beta-galactosidase [bacterium]|nr:beta-galactosidase [bacterium]